MTDNECRRLIADMSAIWHNTYRVRDIETEIRVLQRYLGKYTYEQVNYALDAFVASDDKGYPPSCGQLIAKLTDVKMAGKLDANEAWKLVKKAITNSGYHSAEEFDKLPREAQKVVGSPQTLYEWAMDENYNESVIMSQFIKAYNTVINRETAYERMPDNVKALINRALKGSDREKYYSGIESREKQRAVESRQEKQKALEDTYAMHVPTPERVDAGIRKIAMGA